MTLLPSNSRAPRRPARSPCSVSPSSTVGAELNRKLDAASDAPTTFALAYLRSLANGSTAKFKLESSGTLSALYMTKLASGEKVGTRGTRETRGKRARGAEGKEAGSGTNPVVIRSRTRCAGVRVACCGRCHCRE